MPSEPNSSKSKYYALWIILLNALSLVSIIVSISTEAVFCMTFDMVGNSLSCCVIYIQLTIWVICKAIAWDNIQWW